MTTHHHYFGSTAFNWATGKTRKEVLQKLAKAAPSTAIKAQAKEDGLYAWTVRVDLPESADYAIEYYQPQGVPMGNAQEFGIMTVKGYSMPIDREPKPCA